MSESLFKLLGFETFDEFEAHLASFPPASMPVRHRFTPGLYIREILIPAGTVLTSMEHKTEHPFVISDGLIEVISATEGRVTYAAPHTGITRPGTRRILHALEDTVWTTFHVTDETDVEKIGEAILVPNPEPSREQWRLELPQNLPPSP
jgi:hypothetical protein